MRLLLPLGAMFVAAVLIDGGALQIFAPGQLLNKSDPAQLSTRSVLSYRLLGTSEAIRFRRLRTGPHHVQPEAQDSLEPVPNWFVDLIAMPDIDAAFPLTIKEKQVGEIVFSPDVSSEIYEKRITFLALVSCLSS